MSDWIIKVIWYRPNYYSILGLDEGTLDIMEVNGTWLGEWKAHFFQKGTSYFEQSCPML